MPQYLNDKKRFIIRMIEVLASGEPLSAPRHLALFFELEEFLGSRRCNSGLLKNGTPDFEFLNREENRTALQNTLSAMLEATVYPQNIHQLSHYRRDRSKTVFKVNNNLVYKHLQKKLDFESFQKLFKLGCNRGVFSLSFEHHIPKVTEQAGSLHMTRKWPRDHAAMLPLISERYAAELWPGLQAWAEAYSAPEEQNAFAAIFNVPQNYKKNLGISHVFWMDKNGFLTRDKNWHMNQRTESHAALLYGFAQSILQLLENPRPKFKLISPQIIQTVVQLTHYLYVLGPSPSSCGPWEEIAFSGGINWDCACVIEAFQKMNELLLRLHFELPILNKFLQAEKKLLEKFRLEPLLENPSKLKQYIAASQKNIAENYLNEFREIKRIDASSVMLAASDIDLSSDGNIYENIKKRLETLKVFQDNLLGEFGARRYNRFQCRIDNKDIDSCDSYLNLNSDLLLDNQSGRFYFGKRERIAQIEKYGGSVSSVKDYILRQKGFSEKTSAQWGLPVSYAALAFGKMLNKLLNECRGRKHITPEESNLIKTCLNGEEEYIKRSYAGITGIKIDGSIPYKANGTLTDIWKKPEAYQAVTTLRGRADFAFLPGVNSHLGWDAAICYQASQIFLKNLELLESETLPSI